MKRRLFIICLAALAVVMLAGTAPAANNMNLLIMGDDSNRQSVPRNHPMYNAVLNAFSEALQNRGFAVFDETAVTLDTHRQGRTRRRDTELIDVARSVRNPPIDAIVIFSIFPRVVKTQTTIKYTTRIDARALDVRSGRRLGNYSYKPQDLRTIRPNVPRSVLIDKVMELSELAAEDVASALAGILRRQVRPGTGNVMSDYRVVLRGFGGKAASDFERYLREYECYKNIRVARATGNYHEYSYRTCLQEADLRRQIVETLEMMGVKARVYVEGNTLTIRRTR